MAVNTIDKLQFLSFIICGNNRHFSLCLAIYYQSTLVALVGSAIWSILREAASRGPSVLADILVIVAVMFVISVL